jgi:hypothetical protein
VPPVASAIDYLKTVRYLSGYLTTRHPAFALQQRRGEGGKQWLGWPLLVIPSGAKHLRAHSERPFAEFTLSEANGLKVTSAPHSLSSLPFYTLSPQ